jgi:nicotinamidase-related amidase
MKEGLIIIDIQNDYFHNGTMTLVNSDIACENAKLLLDRFRSRNLPVIFIQHIANGPSATFFLPGTKGVEIHKTVYPLENEKVIIKHFPNSFRETDLLEYLKGTEITDLVICGMMTHMCVGATTRATKDFEFNITVIGDALCNKGPGN